MACWLKVVDIQLLLPWATLKKSQPRHYNTMSTLEITTRRQKDASDHTVPRRPLFVNDLRIVNAR